LNQQLQTEERIYRELATTPRRKKLRINNNNTCNQSINTHTLMNEVVTNNVKDGLTIQNNSSMVWEIGVYSSNSNNPNDSSVELLSILSPNGSIFITRTSVTGRILTIRPSGTSNNNTEFAWQSKKQGFSFDKIFAFESRNMLARCKSIKSKQKVYCILHLTRPNNITSYSDCNIRIMAPFAVENALASSCKFTIYTKRDNSLNAMWSAELHQGEKRDIYTLPLTRKLFLQSIIQQADCSWKSEDLCLVYSPNGDSQLQPEFVNVDQNGRKLVMKIDYYYTMNSYHEFCIYSSFWIVNDTDIRLQLCVGDEEAPGQRNNEDRLLKPRTLMFDYWQQNQDRVNIKTNGLISEHFSLENIGMYDINLENETDALTLGMQMDFGVGVFKRTKVVTFTPTLVLVNRIDSRLSIKPVGSDSALVLDGKCSKNFYATKTTHLSVKLDYSEWSDSFRVDHKDSFHLILRHNQKLPSKRKKSYISVNLLHEKGILIVSFEQTEYPPYYIDNKTNQNLFFCQDGVSKFFSLQNHFKVPFAWPDPTKHHKLKVHIGDIDQYLTTIDVDADAERICVPMWSIQKFIVFSISYNTSRTIQITEEDISAAKLKPPTIGEPCISPVTPNSPRYEEMFEHGSKRDGQGSITYSSGVRNWSVVGVWSNGLPISDCKFTLKSDTYKYYGHVKLVNTQQHQHQLDINDFHKINRGEFYRTNGEFYYGSFKDNMRSGYGLQIYANKSRYYGLWKDDSFHGYGTFVDLDGSIFQGIYENGKRKGNGTMYWPNGDCMSGKWIDTTVKNGVFKKGNCSDCSAMVLAQMKHQIEQELESKLSDDFIFPLYTQPGSKDIRLSSSSKWKQFQEDNESLYKREIESVATFFKESTESHNQDGIIKYTTILLKGGISGCNFLSFFLEFAKDAIHGAYFAELHTKNMKNKTITIHVLSEDVKSAIKFVKKVVMSYLRLALGDSVRASQKFKIFLATYIHNQLFSIVFPIYEMAHRNRDLELNHKIKCLLHCSPLAFGIPREHLPANDKETPYEKSISIFNQLKEKKTVQEKIDVLSRTRTSMIEEIAGYQRISKRKANDHQVAISADDTAPVMTYVFAKSEITNHCAYSQYLFNWKSGFIDIDNPNHPFLTGYMGFPDYILELTLPSKNKRDVLVSTKQLCTKIEKTLWELTPATLDWIPELFLCLSIEVEGIEQNSSVLYITREEYSQLVQDITKHYETVQKVLIKSDLGLRLQLSSDKIALHMDNIYPAGLYYDISLHMYKFIRELK
jgi:hypothetical protein